MKGHAFSLDISLLAVPLSIWMQIERQRAVGTLTNSDAILWSAMLFAFVLEGQVEPALQLFRQIKH